MQSPTYLPPSGSVLAAELRLPTNALDYTILGIYFVVVLGIGFAARSSVKTSLDFFLSGVPRDIRDAFVRAHTGRDALRRSFGFYRDDGAAIRAAGRLTVPTLALGGSVVGDLLHQQLKPVADDLTGEIIEGSGHLIPLDRPDAVAERLLLQ